ncbi:hypothetical protein BpHYR1_052549 [Brachionus plicatilis]|uniref:Uncharacterized protein n=1 Tax=Brachionus plicatilis TaxID=10195 RepID=A0A3M7QYS6_BRAPC|nr:hypothetical protein BpHYR1_052549 [Brachionus plicatilis]
MRGCGGRRQRVSVHSVFVFCLMLLLLLLLLLICGLDVVALKIKQIKNTNTTRICSVKYDCLIVLVALAPVKWDHDKFAGLSMCKVCRLPFKPFAISAAVSVSICVVVWLSTDLYSYKKCLFEKMHKLRDTNRTEAVLHFGVFLTKAHLALLLTAICLVVELIFLVVVLEIHVLLLLLGVNKINLNRIDTKKVQQKIIFVQFVSEIHNAVSFNLFNFLFLPHSACCVLSRCSQN